MKDKNVNPDRTVEIVNYMKDHAVRGDPGGKFAVVNAGGGFVYVAAMHDSFPHALELSKRGYNAFALIYCPGAETACEDLARAIAFIHEHADELGVDVTDYSLWGGSAGARMAAWLCHGFGLGEGTAAEGWIDRAVSFWERNMQKRN